MGPALPERFLELKASGRAFPASATEMIPGPFSQAQFGIVQGGTFPELQAKKRGTDCIHWV